MDFSWFGKEATVNQRYTAAGKYTRISVSKVDNYEMDYPTLNYVDAQLFSFVSTC